MADDLEERIDKIGAVLGDERRPLKERFRALFTLRNIGGAKSIECIGRCFSDPSALLKHELAYCLGQMRDEAALPLLYTVLADRAQEPMVRHEAGEAIGAIGSDSSVGVLTEYSTDGVQEVAETCRLALRRIEWLGEGRAAAAVSPYRSVDPTPASECDNVGQLRRVLLDGDAELFDRYMAMFALRNINTDEAVDALCEGLFTGSALFRHEIAFVLGQLRNVRSAGRLIEALSDVAQNEMVRHECAEALGSIAGGGDDGDRIVETLRKYQSDGCRVVRESCDIALDMADYETSDEFQYANTAALVA